MIENKSISPNTPIFDLWNKGGFILCVKGTARIKINEQYFILTPGNLLIVTPLVVIYEFDKSDDYEEVSFIDDLKVFYPVFHAIMDTVIPLQVSTNPLWKISESEQNFILKQNSYIEDRKKLFQKKATIENRLIKLQIECIKQAVALEIIRKKLSSESDLQPVENHQAILVYSFVLSLHENYAIQRNVSWYAMNANLSVGYFSSLVKNITGMPPSAWIEKITVTYAKMLLERTSKSIKEIASDLNFPEQFTFRKYFKTHTGMSPSTYRKSFLFQGNY